MHTNNQVHSHNIIRVTDMYWRNALSLKVAWCQMRTIIKNLFS